MKRPTSRQQFQAFLERIQRDPRFAAHGAGNDDPAGRAPAARGENKDALRFFLRTVAPHKLSIGLALVAGSVAAILGLVLPSLPKLAIDYALIHPKQPGAWAAYLPPLDQPMARVLVFAAIAVVAQLVATLLSTWARGRMERIATVTEMRMRRRVFAKALRLPLHRIALTKTGGLVSIIRDEVAVFAELTRLMFLGPFTSLVAAAATVIIVAAIDVWLLLGPFILVPILWATRTNWNRRLRPFWVGARDARIASDGLATEALRGVRVVRSYRSEATETRRFTVGSHLIARQRILAWWRGRFVGATWEILAALGSATFLVYGGWRVVQGALTIGDLLWFLASLAALVRPASTLVQLTNDLFRHLVRVDRVVQLLAEPDDVPRGEGRTDLSSLEPTIRLEDVRFTYPSAARPALDGVSLEIPAGRTVALVGPSGGGKSTLAQLVARLADPQSGMVRFGGEDVRGLDVKAYRREVALVDQDTFVFDASIAENIAYGRRSATLDEIKAAGERAGVADFASGPDGWSRRVGEQGWSVSGGQRQRISIARALLSNARVVVFDEATSQLDSETEAHIQRALAELRGSKTVLLIAHRLSTVRTADAIYVVENGRVVEHGTHVSLMAAQGRYAALVAEQLDRHH